MSISWYQAVRRLRGKRPDLDGSKIRIALLDLTVENTEEDVVTDRVRLSSSSRHTAAMVSLLASEHGLCPGLVPKATLLGLPCFSRKSVDEPRLLKGALERARLERVHVVLLGGGLRRNWPCAAGDCDLCRAADDLVLSHNIAVVAPAGNNHYRDLDEPTEILCPAHAREAVAVGALASENPRRPYTLSSRGPSADSRRKPDLSALGFELPCLAQAGALSSELLDIVSGTSAAAALVAGFLALMIQEQLNHEGNYRVSEVLADLFELTASPASQRSFDSPQVFGHGCLDSEALSRWIT